MTDEAWTFHPANLPRRYAQVARATINGRKVELRKGTAFHCWSGMMDGADLALFTTSLPEAIHEAERAALAPENAGRPDGR